MIIKKLELNLAGSAFSCQIPENCVKKASFHFRWTLQDHSSSGKNCMKDMKTEPDKGPSRLQVRLLVTSLPLKKNCYYK